MPRISIDSAGSGSKSKSSGSSGKSKSSGGPSGPTTKDQKVKLIVAVSVIVLCGVFLAYMNGLFDFGPGAPLPPTPEEQKAFEEQQRQMSEPIRLPDGRVVTPPPPAGS